MKKGRGRGKKGGERKKGKRRNDEREGKGKKGWKREKGRGKREKDRG